MIQGWLNAACALDANVTPHAYVRQISLTLDVGYSMDNQERIVHLELNTMK